jgi:uncharacterized protein (TIGR00290 family)
VKARPGIEPVVLAWSGGKDSALALRALREAGTEVACLLTTVTQPYDRVSVHGVRRALLEAQVRSLGLPLATATLPPDCDNAAYEAAFAAALEPWRERGVRTVAFGDLFLEDIRRYREEQLATLGMRATFPLWEEDTGELARDFLALGYRAVLTVVDTEVLDAGFAGRDYDAELLRDLPEGVDPCGENGEFHTFVYDGSDFTGVVRFERGETVLRDERFAFRELLPGRPVHFFGSGG